MRTRFAKQTDLTQKWYVVDADSKVLGRLATKIATYLRGKNKPQFTPNVDCGDYIIVINAEKVILTGNKLDNKVYETHSGFPGGFKSKTARELMEKKPEQIITEAVWGMLPKGRLGRAIFKKLKVYKGAENPHAAQKPEVLN